MAEQADAASAGARASRAGGRRRSRLRRWLFASAVLVPLAGLGLWFAVHRISWLGPLVANGLRATIGSENVTRLEEIAYAAEDQVNRVLRRNELPKTYWEVPEPAPPPDPAPRPDPAPAASGEPREASPPFRPRDVGPMHASWSAPGDGRWVPILDRRRPSEPPCMMKTLLHPDEGRSWAELFIVAVDLRSVELHLMAGSREPAATTKEGESYQRPAKIPEQDHERLLAAFNGGFMTEHGRWGMRVESVTLVPPRDEGCTIALHQGEQLRIAPWPAIASSEGELRWWRQAPSCMVDEGKIHPLLNHPSVRNWGATLEGNTVIRRSAVGLDEGRTTLFVGISNHTTAQAIARGMHHAGAFSVAQLDVNWSYPKFLVYEPGPSSPELMPVALAKGFEFSEHEYIRKRSLRDFFYLTRRPTGR